MIESRAKPLKLGVLFVAILCVAWARPWVLAQNAALRLDAAAEPASVSAGSPVTYNLTLRNGSEQVASGVSIEHELPPGFRYVLGSSRILHNHTLVSPAEPSISGQSLTWSGLALSAARTTSHFGMHTFVQDRCDASYIGYQLDRVRELMGPSAFAKQLFYRITTETKGPEKCWVEFVNGCYDRDLIPVVRLQGLYGGPNWIKPPARSPGDYTDIAQAYARVVASLPRRSGRRLYVEIWNEPNLDIEWSGSANAVEYAHFLVDAAAAIRALGDPRIVILNGGLSPGGNVNSLTYIDGMAGVPGALDAFDVWSVHPYPGNHPPEYNIHDDTAPVYPDLTIDSYLLELQRLADHGRVGVPVLLTETGYALGQNNFGFQGYPPIEESNRADYIARALRDYWSRWPEVIGVCPYELVDPHGNWGVWDWLFPGGSRHPQYDAVAALDKTPERAEGELVIRFQARAGAEGGVFPSRIRADTANLGSAALEGAAPVRVDALPGPTATRTFEPTRTSTPTPSEPPVCHQVQDNGGFETDSGWDLLDTTYPAGYSRDVVHSGERSLRVGIVADEPIYSYSSARQSFDVPALATGVRIQFRYYPRSTDELRGWQYVLLLDTDRQYLETVLWVIADDRQWLAHEYSLSGHAGKTLWLQFGVHNDGEGGPTAMYVDEVVVEVCLPQSVATVSPTPTQQVPASVTPTPTVPPTRTATRSPTEGPTPSPTAPILPTITASATGTVSEPPATVTRTPPPSATASHVAPSPTPTSDCTEVLENGGFEWEGEWLIPQTSYPARYTGSRRRTGDRSMQLGITTLEDNIYSYSSFEQTVSLPNLPHLELSFWYLPVSDDPVGDRQYLLMLESDGSYRMLMWVVSDAVAWTERRIDLSAYAGEEVTLRFGVYNDGDAGVTSMYVDDVSLLSCSSEPHITPTPTATAQPTSTPPGMTPTQPAPSPTAPVFEVRTVQVGRSPHGVAVDPSTGLVYTANYLGGNLSVVDPLGGQVVQTIGLGGAAGCEGIAVDTVRERAYVANGLSDDLSAVDLISGAHRGSVALGRQPMGVAVDPRDGTVFVSNFGSGTVSVVDGASLRETRVRQVGSEPTGLALDLDRERLAVVNHHPLFSSLSLLSLASGDSLGNASVGSSPKGIALDPATGRLFVANTTGRSVSVVDTRGNTIDEIWLPGEVHQVAYSPRIGYLFAVCPNLSTLYVVDGSTGKPVTSLRIGRGARYGIALDDAAQRLYVTNAEDDSLSIISYVDRTRLVWLPLLTKGSQYIPSRASGPVPLRGLPRQVAEPEGMPALRPSRGIRRLPLPTLPDSSEPIRALALDAVRRRILVAAGNQIVSLDAHSGRPIYARSWPSAPGDLAVEQKTGRTLVALPEDGQVYGLSSDGRTMCVGADLGRPVGVAIGEGRTYVADAAGARLVVLDTEDCGIIQTLSLPAAPFPMVLDDVSGRLCIGLMGRGTVFCIDALSLAPLSEVALGGLGYPQDLAVDAATGTLYVAHALSHRYGALSAIGKTDGDIRTLWGVPNVTLYGTNSVATDASRGVTYLGVAHEVIVVDSGDLSIRGGVSLPRSVWSGGLQVDPLDGALYLASDDGALLRWHDTLEVIDRAHRRR